jgi:hypothetical protein
MEGILDRANLTALRDVLDAILKLPEPLHDEVARWLARPNELDARRGRRCREPVTAEI